MSYRPTADSLFLVNPSLESFLKRSDVADERIWAYDACVVESDREKKSFMYVIVTDKDILLTENPSKTIYSAVALSNVLSVDLVNEYPDFLNGQDRENTQHIAIRYVSGSVARGNKSSSNQHTTASGTQISSRPSWKKLNTSLEEMKVKWSDRRASSRHYSGHDELSDSLPTTQLKSLKNEGVMIENAESRLSSTLPSQLTLPTSPSRNNALQVPGEGGLPLDRRKTRSLINRRAASKAQATLPSRSISIGSSLYRAGGHGEAYDDDSNQIIERKVEDALTRQRAPSRNRRHSSGDSSKRNKTSTSSAGESMELKKKSSESGRLSRVSLTSHGSGSSVDLSLISPNSNQLENMEMRESVLHLYILRPHVPMMMLIRIAWINFNSRATRESTGDDTRTGVPKLSKEQTTYLFNQLSSELRHGDNNIEQLYALIAELSRAASWSHQIKVCFWKSVEMPVFFMQQLNKIVYSEKLSHPHHLELITVLLETLKTMFQDTDILVDRLHYLKANKCNAVFDLLKIIMLLPSKLESSCGLSLNASINAGNGYQVIRMTNMNVEIQKLDDDELRLILVELTQAINSLMYEILQVTHQPLWLHRWDMTELNFSNVISFLEEHFQHTQQFVQRLCLEIFESMVELDSLSGIATVRFYENMFILNDINEHSPTLASYIKQTYSEEFRYYFKDQQNTEIKHPIAKHLVPLMNSVNRSIRQ